MLAHRKESVNYMKRLGVQQKADRRKLHPIIISDGLHQEIDTNHPRLTAFPPP